MIGDDDVAGLCLVEYRFDHAARIDQRAVTRAAGLQIDPVHLEIAEPGAHQFLERARLADTFVTV